MRKLALLVAVAVAASTPSLAFAAKKAKKAAKAPETMESLNKDSIKAFHDFFVWPSETKKK